VHQIWVPLKNTLIMLLSTNLARERLQIAKKYGFLVNLIGILGCDAHYK